MSALRERLRWFLLGLRLWWARRRLTHLNAELGYFREMARHGQMGSDWTERRITRQQLEVNRLHIAHRTGRLRAD